MTSTVAEQADEIGRECRQRERIYPIWIENGRIRPETAQRKIAIMRDAERTLRFIGAHAQALRGLCHFLIAASAPAADAQAAEPQVPTPDEAQALLAHPGVQSLLEAWPEAEVRILGPIQPPAPPEPDHEQYLEGESDAA